MVDGSLLSLRVLAAIDAHVESVGIKCIFNCAHVPALPERIFANSGSSMFQVDFAFYLAEFPKSADAVECRFMAALRRIHHFRLSRFGLQFQARSRDFRIAALMRRSQR
jgi:hypothetical protein